MKYLKRLKARNWAWLHVMFVVGIIWPTFMVLSPPELIVGVLNPVILAIAMIISMIGTIIAMLGYFLSQQLGKMGVIGVSLELAGLILSAVGPAAYFITRIYMILFEGAALSSPLFFSYALWAVYLFRFVIIIPRFRFEAQDPNKE